jgi:serine/threonine-protein kinase
MSAPVRTIGNYTVGPLIGRGGMSEVYAAKHRFLGDEVAIKLLRSHLAGDTAANDAFVAEATQTRAIEHPNVVRVLDFGCESDGFYLVMERLEGETLAKRLSRGRLDEATARAIGAAIADGVSAAHARGIVHRDLKPGNIVLVADQPKIVDFGIARYIGGDAPVSTGSRIGTPAYMAPEQLTGGLIAPCVDVWALGIVLFELVAGSVPFQVTEGRCPQLFEPAPRIPVSVSPEYARLVGACLQREPGARPSSMAEVARALRDPVGGERITEDAGALVVLPPPHRRRRVYPPLIAGSALLLIGASALAWQLLRAPQSAAADPPPLPPPAAAPVPVPVPVPDLLPPVPPAPAPAPAAIEIRSSPTAAEITVAGKHVGTTPATIAVPWPATIVVTRRGYKPAHIRADGTGPINLELVPLHRGAGGSHSQTTPPATQARAGETLD